MPNPEAATFESYLEVIPAERADGTKQIIDMMRKELRDADEDVRWGIAILSRDGEDICGIAARSGFYSLYVPNALVGKKWLPKLGKTNTGRGCIRFTQIEDVDLTALRGLVRELSQSAGATTAAD